MKLDYGCGPGGFYELQEDRAHRNSWLVENGGADSIGIDINPKNIKQGKDRISNGSHLAVADGRKLPFKNESFDYVHECGALHHMSDYREGIQEIARVMEDGSKLWMRESVSNDPLFSLARKFIGWRGDDVESRFTSDELCESLTPYFIIKERRYYWRAMIADAVAYFEKEPNWCLIVQDKISNVFNKIGLGKFTCNHFVVIAIKKEDHVKE